MRAKYVFQWFPPIFEEELQEIKIKELMSEFEKEMLKDELGIMMFGEEYNTMGIGNPELPSRLAGNLGGMVKKWQDVLMQEIVLKQDK